MTKLTVKDLAMRYDGKETLTDINFSVEEGEFLSILGPSGCGKTTMLRILIGLLIPTEGKIYKDGQDITCIPSGKRGMGIVFQNYALFENMTVLENVTYALNIRKENRSMKKRAEIEDRALQILDMLSLKPYANKLPLLLSGGQQQRTAIARTLITNPDMILFDEPMSALDAAARISLQQELKKIQKNFGTTMIYVTHDQEEAFLMSDRIMIMKEAHIVQIGTPKEILEHPADDYVKNFVLNNLQMKLNALQNCLK